MNLALLASDQDTKRAETLIDTVSGEALALAEEHWRDIELLAHRLLEAGTVNCL
jgi:hypothetical protein